MRLLLRTEFSTRQIGIEECSQTNNYQQRKGTLQLCWCYLPTSERTYRYTDKKKNILSKTGMWSWSRSCWSRSCRSRNTSSYFARSRSRIRSREKWLRLRKRCSIVSHKKTKENAGTNIPAIFSPDTHLTRARPGGGGGYPPIQVFRG